MPLFLRFPFEVLPINHYHKGTRWEKVGKFYGTYIRNIDSKGRLPLPTKLVGENPIGTLYAMKGLDGCLSVYSKEDFDKEMDRLSNLDYLSPKRRAYVRICLDSVEEMKVDARGRLLISAETVRKYSLKEETLLLGAIDHFEIWEKGAYEAYLSSLDDFEKLAGDISNEGK